ncbi:haloacid dehalogenase type II [Vibrio gallicus]|uniref:haloacid dehalogenase type II n=1 Tax=Vibrio gallicus TaxID=190897 RepID=UPI0021C376E8|nr:haloacid dehalogenase type II [Vibrio gallicus]
MTKTLAFDVYGTLIDTQGVTQLLENWIGNKAWHFSQTWLNKQLEYSYRRGVVDHYQPFTQCALDALEYACKVHQMALSSHQKNMLMQEYLSLSAFPDVLPALEQLSKAGIHMLAFSNGEQSNLRMLLEQAGLSHYFQKVISCEDVGCLMPSSKVYQHLIEQMAIANNQAWLISSHSFDVTGATNVGINSVWVQRNRLNTSMDWNCFPNLTVGNLLELPLIISNA